MEDVFFGWFHSQPCVNNTEICLMAKGRFKNPVFLFYLLVAYVVVQFSWWLYLIYSLYTQTYENKDQLALKTWMLIGEGSVFLIILLGVVYIIRRSLKREREINDLQQNFLQSVSHELKTPLSSIGLFIETLKKRELTNEKREEIYDRSLAEVKRLNHLISDILTARNIESENYFIHLEDIELSHFLEDKVKTLSQTIMRKHKVNLETQDLIAKLDKEAMASIIYNLIENACKYSDQNSVITIRLFKSNLKTCIQVSDEGAGISDSNKGKVFSKFYRYENEMTRKSKGTGLGLYITKFLVEKQNGQIILKDNEPKGLTVEIQF